MKLGSTSHGRATAPAGSALLVLFLLMFGVACGGSQNAAGSGTQEAGTAGEGSRTTVVASRPLSVTYTEEDLDEGWSQATATTIELAGDSIEITGQGAVAQGGDVVIAAGGVYVISGRLDDGQMIVDSEDKDTVRLVFNGVDINCSTSAPLYVKSAQNTIITLAEDTANSVTDGESYAAAAEGSDEPDAAIYCKSDLTINGTGSLTVTANYNNGITGKDTLKITGGSITVEAANDAVRGRDCIGVKAGTFNLTAGGDGMQSNNDEDPERGFISIEDGIFNITSQGDGIQAETTLLVNGGSFAVTSGGGSGNAVRDWGGTGGFGGGGAPDQGRDPQQGISDNVTTGAAETSSDSAKGLKAGVIVAVKGGTLSIDSADDGIHSDNRVTVEGGDITLASGDDGIHADAGLVVEGGDIDITTCYEGFESAGITIDDGTVHIMADDDGMNTVSDDEEDTSGARFQRQGGGPFEGSSDNDLLINGGYIAMDASGDGLDIGGAIEMTGGTVIINGPAGDGNGSLDYLGEFKITGGYFVAAGSSGMAQGPSESSTQYSLMINLEQAQEAGTLVHIEDEEGRNVLTFSPTKQYQSVVFCSADLQDEATYRIYLGGSASGTTFDGLYSDGTYTPGTENSAFTISSMVTTIGTARGGMQGGGPRRTERQ